MFKKAALILLLFCSSFAAFAQADANAMYDKYLDFNLARLQNETTKAMELGESILPDAAKLAPGPRINFYNSIAKLYEDDSQSLKAISYYEKVVAAVPDYYVAHRALGYLFIKDIEPASPTYMAQVKKALPHLEKAQACDPSDETLALIKMLYKNINDNGGLNSLNTRLAEMSKHCIDLLDDKVGQ